MNFAIVVHGGAGLHSENSEARVNAAMKRACLRAADILRSKGGTALDAVEGAIRELEDSEDLNAGYGANLTTDKKIECDASLMESTGAFGAVGAIRGIKNPVTAARVVLERARDGRKALLGRVPPLLVCGEGACAYVTEDVTYARKALLGPPVKVPIESLISPRAEREWSYWSERYRVAGEVPIEQETISSGDTVGAVVICENGDAASGVSSGGLLLKYPGRIGEAAVYGAGSWVGCERNQRGELDGIALSVSGTGEDIIRGALARTLGEACNPAICDDPIGMMKETFQNFMGHGGQEEEVHKVAVNAGAVTLLSMSKGDGTSSVRLVVAFTTPSMAIATFSPEDPNPKASIHRTHKLQSKSSLYLWSPLITRFRADQTPA